MNWIDLIARAPAKKPCLITEHGALTYGELLHYMRRIGGGFVTRGWRPGRRIFLAANDDRHVLCAAMAALANGLVPVMADPAAPAPAAAVLRQVADTDACILDLALAESWGISADVWQIRPEPPRRAGELYRRLLRRNTAPAQGWFAELDALGDGPPAWQPSGDAPAMIFYTSGTTSRPKGVALSHGAITAHIATLARQFAHGPDSLVNNLLPWHHVDGFMQGPLVTLAAGGTLYRPAPFRIANIQRIVDSLYADRITHLVAVPTMLAIIVRLADGLRDVFETPELRMVISTAGYLDENLWRNFEDRARVRLVNVYGLTETVSGGLFCGPDDATRRIGTLGRPVDCRARIVDGEGRDLADGETGELWLAGENMMLGYLNDPDATAAVLKDGWLRTGDLAKRDSEGFFHFAGRLKNVLVSGGHTIQPEEITAALKTHPGVAEAVTIGMAHAELEEAAIAAVVPAPGNTLDEETLIEHCRAYLAPYKVPRRIVILKELPYGPSGKVRADDLRALIGKTQAGAGHEATDRRVLDIARRCFHSHIELSAASVPETTPGWDSMAHLEFVMALEAAFAIRLSSQDIMNLTSLAAAIEIVEAGRHG